MSLNQLTQSPFVKNVLTVATGAAGAQVVAFIFTPIITRLYGPEAYGLQSLFISTASILALVASLGYPAAMILPTRDNDAVQLGRLSLICAAGIAVVVLIVLLVVGEEILRALAASAITPLMFLLPLALVASVAASVLSSWLNRTKEYALAARYSVFGACLGSSSKVVLGLAIPSAFVLIATNLVVTLVGTLLTYLAWKRRHAAKSTSLKDSAISDAKEGEGLCALAMQHKDFALLRTPQNVINAVSQSLPLFILAAYVGPASPGQYALALATLAVPAGLIGGSIATVFYPRITDAVRSGENARDLIIRATVGMAAIGALPFLAILVAGPWMFSAVFGGEWQKAGLYAQWLAPWLFLQYLNKPAVAAIPSLRIQGGFLIYEILSSGSKAGVLWIGFEVFESEIVAIALFSLIGSLAYVLLIGWVILGSARRDHR